MKAVNLLELLDKLVLIVRHLVMAHWFVEETIEGEWCIPPLGSYHESGDAGEAGLQGDDHEVSHEADVFPAREDALPQAPPRKR